MSLTDRFISDSKTILSNKNDFAVDIDVNDPVNGLTTIEGIFNSYKAEVETNTGIPQIIQMVSVTFDRSVLESNLSELPKKSWKIQLTYSGNFLKYRIEEVDEDKTFNSVNYLLAVDNG